MATINLRDYYPWYTHDEFLEVSDEVAAKLLAGKRYEQTHERIQRRFSVLSLDAEDGTAETAAVACHGDNPEQVFAMMERHCQLCCSLNSLPEAQGRRVEARYLLGKSIREIAEAENVTESSVKESINRGLKAMEKTFTKKFSKLPCETP